MWNWIIKEDFWLLDRTWQSPKLGSLCIITKTLSSEKTLAVRRIERQEGMKAAFICGSCSPRSQRGVPAAQGLGQRLGSVRLLSSLPVLFCVIVAPEEALHWRRLARLLLQSGKDDIDKAEPGTVHRPAGRCSLGKLTRSKKFEKPYRNIIISFWHFQGSWQQNISSASHQPVSSSRDGPSHFTGNEKQLQGTNNLMPAWINPPASSVQADP